MHRREGVVNPGPRSRPRSSRTVEGKIDEPRPSRSRPSTPTATRSATPPPSLPPPSLKDLGLSLSSITSDLSPAHFSAPPTNGAFLAPHYLLLCHAQGLDVLPLTYPPSPQPYALIRRVSFKSVVVMEHRGVLVAIAGRRDGVRVYALEEVKKAVEWRVDVEIRREAEKKRREEAKRATVVAKNEQLMAEKSTAPTIQRPTKPRSPSFSGPEKVQRGKLTRKASAPSHTNVPVPPLPKMPSQPARRPKTPPARSTSQISSPPLPSDPPPAYQPNAVTPPARPTLRPQAPATFAARRTSVSDVLQGPPRLTAGEGDQADSRDEKAGDWAEGRHSSDEEAIDVVAAPSGSQALDERTSAQAQSTSVSAAVSASPTQQLPLETTTASIRRTNRPANLDLSFTGTNSIPAPQPSPSPTLMTLRQALAQSPPVSMRRNGSTMNSLTGGAGGQEGPGTPDVDGDDEDEPVTPTGGERISLAQALFESRRPELPPAGTRQPQQAILIGSHTVAPPEEETPASPRSSDAQSFQTRGSISAASSATARRRRRWSVLDGIFSGPLASSQPTVTPVAEMTTNPPTPAERYPSAPTPLTRDVNSNGLRRYTSHTIPPQVASVSTHGLTSSSVEALLPPPPVPTSSSSSQSRFSRFINSAFHPRRGDDNAAAVALRSHVENKPTSTASQAAAPAPKLEYVKLPGTKGAVMIKSVETAKKR
jgi:hypothetical protein